MLMSVPVRHGIWIRRLHDPGATFQIAAKIECHLTIPARNAVKTIHLQIMPTKGGHHCRCPSSIGQNRPELIRPGKPATARSTRPTSSANNNNDNNSNNNNNNPLHIPCRFRRAYQLRQFRRELREAAPQQCHHSAASQLGSAARHGKSRAAGQTHAARSRSGLMLFPAGSLIDQHPTRACQNKRLLAEQALENGRAVRKRSVQISPR